MTTTDQKLHEIRKAIRDLNDQIRALKLEKGILPDEELNFAGEPTADSPISKTEAAQAALGRSIIRKMQGGAR